MKGGWRTVSVVPTSFAGLSYEIAPDGARVRLSGDLDMSTAPLVQVALMEALDRRPSAMTLDLAGVGFADTAGLRALAVGMAACQKAGAALSIASMRRRHRELFQRLFPGVTTAFAGR